MKTIILFIMVLLLFFGCERSNPGFDAGGPITRHLVGRWQLEKVVAPSGIKTGDQLPYSEVLERGNDQVDDYEKVFRDGVLLATYTMLRSPAPIANAKDMTMTISYFGGKKRFYKIRQDPARATVEATDYLQQIGSPQDSVRYYYYRIQ